MAALTLAEIDALLKLVGNDSLLLALRAKLLAAK